VPAVAALAALHRFSGAPDGVAAWADQSSGVVAIVAAGKGESPRLFVRILRDDSSDTDAFAAVRDEAIADARADLDAPEPVSIGRALRLPRHPSHNPGVTGEDKLSDYALALGAAAAVMEGKPDEQPLFTMADRSPTAGRTVFKRVADGLSSPKALAVTAAACVVLLLGGWILAAPIKLAILHNRVGNDTGDYTKAIQQHDWYKALRDKRWPMTALMAELTSAAPQGVHVETLTMEQGRPITLTGSAETADSVYAWCKSLRGKIFTEAKPTIPREDVQPVRFSIRADVADAMAAAVSELKPVAVSEATRPPRSDSGSRTDRNTPRNNNNGRSNNGGNNNGRSTQPAGRTPAATPSQAVVEVPPAMTDAQIDRLNSGTAMLEWAKRKGQVNRTDLDGATRARLEHEIQRIEARRKALEGGAK
jgi:hypothetical protein